MLCVELFVSSLCLSGYLLFSWTCVHLFSSDMFTFSSFLDGRFHSADAHSSSVFISSRPLSRGLLGQNAAATSSWSPDSASLFPHRPVEGVARRLASDAFELCRRREDLLIVWLWRRRGRGESDRRRRGDKCESVSRHRKTSYRRYRGGVTAVGCSWYEGTLSSRSMQACCVELFFSLTRQRLSSFALYLLFCIVFLITKILYNVAVTRTLRESLYFPTRNTCVFCSFL